MLEIRRSHDRGYSDEGWLQSYHTFAHADYYDPEYVQYGPLRALNEERAKPGAVSPMHPHQDMEVLSYVLDGRLEQRDVMGNSAVLQPGDVQIMSAGTGIAHTESNASATEPLHYLQVWIAPSTPGLPPSYDQKHFPVETRRGRLRLVVSPRGEHGTVKIHQDARVYLGLLHGSERVVVAIARGRLGFIFVARGSIAANGMRLNAGDSMKISRPASVELHGGRDAELIVFDLPFMPVRTD